MKKFYKLALTLLCANTAFGQLNENFDASTNLPSGWTSFRGTNGLGAINDWKVSNVHNFSIPNCATVTYENVSGGLAEDWLVTPLVNLTNITGSCSLSFYGGQHYATNYGSTYKVKVSTTSQTDHASFTDVATYSESDFSVGAITSLKTIDLSAYNGQQIYIAFVMIQDNGDNWYIDNVNVTDTLGTTEFENNSNLTAYPNPTKDFVKIETVESIKKIDVYDVIGNEVRTPVKGNYVDLTGLLNGIYILKVMTNDGKITSKKIMKI